MTLPFDGYTFVVTIGSRRLHLRQMLSHEWAVHRRVLQEQGTQLIHQIAPRYVTPIKENSPGWSFLNGDQKKIVLRTILPDRDRELADIDNLITGIRLEHTHRFLAERSCESCKIWWYDDDSNEILTKGGIKLKRQVGDDVLPCQTRAGCPKGTPENQKSLSVKNRAAFRHYLEWSGVGCPNPEDATCRRNWRVIQKTVRQLELEQLVRQIRK